MLSARLYAVLSPTTALATLASLLLLSGCGPEQRDPTAGVTPAAQNSDTADDRAIVAAEPPASAIAAIERRIAAGARRFRRTEHGFAAVNDGQRLETTLDGRGARLRAKSTDNEDGISLGLVGWGRGKTTAAAEAQPALGACAADGSVDEQGSCIERLELARSGLIEWWENRSDGLEHGFTLAERPAGTLPLRLDLRVDGARVALDSNGAGATFETAAALRLRYTNLVAVDADGRGIPARMVQRAGGLALEVDDKNARYPLVVDPLVTSPVFTAESNQTLAAFGYSAAGAGDVNGDGYADVVVGAWLYDNGESDEGRAYLFLGSAGGLSATAAWTAEVNQAGASFGRTVASAGDVNGDGYSDVIVGAPDYSNEEVQEGAVFLYLGSASGLAATPAWTGEGGQDGAQFGLAISSAGDVNRDGRSDVIVGVPYFDNGQLDEGQARVYLGTATGLAASPSWTGESDQTGAYYGTSVARAGDVNRDSYGDVVVGSPYYDNGNTDEGRTYSYHGSAGGLVATAWSVEGAQDTAYFGNSIAGAGDVNGDGYADVIVGASSFTNGQADEGRATVYYGSAMGLSATANWTFEPNQVGAEAGASVASIGDENGDGYSDVAVGVPGYDNGQTDEGRVYFFVGSANGPIAATPTPSTTESDQAGAAYGRSVAAAGDVNGDGYADALIGAPNYDNGQADEGRVYVLNGTGGALHGSASNTFTTTHQAVPWSAGDVNGDGFVDVVIGQAAYTGTLTSEGRLLLYLGSDAGLSSATSWGPTGGQANVGFGAWPGVSGDVNGDGYSDILAGIPGYDGVAQDTGRAHLFLGSPSGPSATPDWTLNGEMQFTTVGNSMAICDVNADGFADALIGMGAYTNPEMFEGRVAIYFGSASGLPASPSVTFDGNAANAGYGGSVSCPGDVDGDGISDFAFTGRVGTTRSIFLYRGTTSGTFGAPFQTVTNATASHLSRTGDVNGDGYADLLAQSARTLYLGSPSGFSASSWVPNLSGLSMGDRQYAGDVNGDGYSDIVSYISGSGITSAYVFYGSSSGPPNTGSIAYSAGAGQAFADVNGDGFSDLVLDNGVTSTGFRTFHGNAAENTGSAFAYAPQARRTGTSTPIVPEGLAPGGAFDARLLGKTAFGRGKLKVVVEAKPFGTPFDGLGLTTAATFTDSGSAGVDLAQAVSGLTGNSPYRFRARLKYDPALGFPQGWSRWLYGGNLDSRRGVHIRSSCVSGDTDGDGTPDCIDGCPNNPSKIAPGACGCAAADTDTDGDGTPNCIDGCPNNAPKIAPGICGCATADTDSDGDGTPNCNDGCPNNAPKTAPGVCGCATADTDSDGDGTPNCNDQCPNNAPKIAPGVCGCTTPDTDNDGDGTPNCNDGCPNNAPKITPGICGCATPDTDNDGDGTPNCNDSCPNDANKTVPGACGCGVSDADSDGDGTQNCNDGCPNDANKTAPGLCGCGTSDADSDGDGTPNCNDGCPNDGNKLAPGLCGCGTSDADGDSDGTPNCNDGCPNDSSKIAPGVCGCSSSDADSDSDGTPNCNDSCPSDPNKTAPGLCGCGQPEITNCGDNCPSDPNKTAPGLCGCGTPDTDSDSDGTPNCTDGCPNDPGKTSAGVCGCGDADTDSDSDGTPNCTDGCPSDPAKTTAGVCGCGSSDADPDGDGTPSCNDDCPNDGNKLAPGVCGCGIADTDTDGDATPNCNDDCPSDAAKTTPGACGCGVADVDTDSDTKLDCDDDCPTEAAATANGCPDDGGGGAGGEGGGAGAGDGGSGDTGGSNANGGSSGNGGSSAGGRGGAGRGGSSSGAAGDDSGAGTGGESGAMGDGGDGGVSGSSGEGGAGLAGSAGTSGKKGKAGSDESSGCGCRVAGESRSSNAGGALGLLLALALWSRRRRAA